MEIKDRLDQAEAKVAAGGTIEEVCKELDISAPTFYGWRKKYGDGKSTVDQGKRLRELEEENAILRNLVADQAIQIARLKG
jgi:transposase-like protein